MAPGSVKKEVVDMLGDEAKTPVPNDRESSDDEERRQQVKPALLQGCVKRIATLLDISRVSKSVYDIVNDVMFTAVFLIVQKADIYREYQELKRINVSHVSEALKQLKLDMYKPESVSQKGRRRSAKKDPGLEQDQNIKNGGSRKRGTRAKQLRKKLIDAYNTGQYRHVVRDEPVRKMLSGVSQLILCMDRHKQPAAVERYKYFLPLSDPIIDFFRIIIVECCSKLFSHAYTYTQALNRKILKKRDIISALIADDEAKTPCYPLLDASFRKTPNTLYRDLALDFGRTVAEDGVLQLVEQVSITKKIGPLLLSYKAVKQIRLRKGSPCQF